MTTPPASATDSARQMLRHTLATLAYRGGKAVRGMLAEAALFKAGPSTRTPAEILAHIGDLLDWAETLARGREAWHDSAPQSWEQDTARFFDGLARLDAYLASDAPLARPAEQIFQGPVADALTHVGQIALLRRLAGAPVLPVRGENYARADIVAGRVGREQAPPRREFD